MLYHFTGIYAVRKAVLVLCLSVLGGAVAFPLGATLGMEIAAGRLKRATLGEADRIMSDPLLAEQPNVAPLLSAALGRESGPESEYILIRILDLLVMDEAGLPRADVLEASKEALGRLAERHPGFRDPGLRYRVLLITAEFDSDAARRMVQQGFARLLSRAAGGGTRLTASELQEALVICYVAERYPDAATSLGAALLAEKSRIPELVAAARNAARAGMRP